MYVPFPYVSLYGEEISRMCWVSSVVGRVWERIPLGEKEEEENARVCGYTSMGIMDKAYDEKEEWALDLSAGSGGRRGEFLRICALGY
jgi:hypothetical protein